uniref:C-type lectin domain-containing protein n=1 Tax=Ditylenchus dipsaci TaxID=166011 RepID=A0A915EMD0_9BILA
MAVEQTLLIDIGRNNYSSGDLYGNGRFGGRGNGLSRGNGPYFSRPTATRDLLPDSTHELKDLIRQMDRRVDRLEANQNNFRQTVMAEWTALNIDKRIRLFNNAKNTWSEAEQICKANLGTLLLIESDEDNRRISELLRNVTESEKDKQLYWIGAQAVVSINFPTDKYNNFDRSADGGIVEEQQGCAAMSSLKGKWASRDCLERHSFICQT